jgi:hypothetical protein
MIVGCGFRIAELQMWNLGKQERDVHAIMRF